MLATVLLPVALIFVVMLANDRGLMGTRVNKRSTNLIGIAIIAFIAISDRAERAMNVAEARRVEHKALARGGTATRAGARRRVGPRVLGREVQLRGRRARRLRLQSYDPVRGHEQLATPDPRLQACDRRQLIAGIEPSLTIRSSTRPRL